MQRRTAEEEGGGRGEDKGKGSSVLDVQLLVVLAHAAGLGGQGVEHHGGVDEVLLHALQPGVQLLEPHQLGRVWGGSAAWQSLAARAHAFYLKGVTALGRGQSEHSVSREGCTTSFLKENTLSGERLKVSVIFALGQNEGRRNSYSTSYIYESIE